MATAKGKKRTLKEYKYILFNQDSGFSAGGLKFTTVLAEAKIFKTIFDVKKVQKFFKQGEMECSILKICD